MGSALSGSESLSIIIEFSNKDLQTKPTQFSDWQWGILAFLAFPEEQESRMRRLNVNTLQPELKMRNKAQWLAFAGASGHAKKKS